VRPSAIFPQKARSRSLRTGGRPGERITARPVNAAAHPGGRPIENTSIVEVLRPPVEPGQYLSLTYTDRLAELGIAPSVGSRGDSYDNALAEAVNAAYKTELINRGRPWRSIDDVELATLSWVHWHNPTRLHSHCGDVPPSEFEAAFYAAQQTDPAGVGNQ